MRVSPQELEVERAKLLEAMHAQQLEFGQTIEKLKSSMASKEAKPSSPSKGNPLEGLQVHEIQNVRLPRNVVQWRTVHAQAWVAFVLELPQYVPQFQSGSIDGLLLLHHVDDEVLHSALGITDELHRKKICRAIQELDKKQVNMHIYCM